MLQYYWQIPLFQNKKVQMKAKRLVDNCGGKTSKIKKVLFKLRALQFNSAPKTLKMIILVKLMLLGIKAMNPTMLFEIG